MLLQDKLIDYALLAEACAYYTRRGYTQIEVPWIVTKEISQSTAPSLDHDYSFILQDNHRLVCSAEQGFVDVKSSGALKKNKKYFAISPCFRDEELDETHSKWFMKLELYFASSERMPVRRMVEVFIRDAKHFFDKQGALSRVSATEIGHDIIYGQLEIGSYGMREFPDHFMAYGTGLALPRLNLCLDGQ